jgi:hypothetical protein
MFSNSELDDAEFKDVFEAIWKDVAEDLTPAGEILSDENSLLDDLTLDDFVKTSEKVCAKRYEVNAFL